MAVCLGDRCYRLLDALPYLSNATHDVGARLETLFAEVVAPQMSAEFAQRLVRAIT